ncbi:MAG: hypothetical protein QXE97_04560 [Candidatus Aenigmatarchaeota archaeon]
MRISLDKILIEVPDEFVEKCKWYSLDAKEIVEKIVSQMIKKELIKWYNDGEFWQRVSELEAKKERFNKV